MSVRSQKKFREAGIDGNAHRGQQFCGKVAGNPDVVTDTPMHVECKFVDRLNLQNAMEQSIRDAEAESEATGKVKIPCVVHRRARTESLVTMRLDDFLPILKGFLDNM